MRIYKPKNETQPIFYTINTNEFKMDSRLKFLEENIRKMFLDMDFATK